MSVARRSLAALVVSLASVASIAAGQTADPHVLEKLRALGRASAGVTTMRARFAQEKHLSIVKDVLRASGTFLLDKRGRVAWVVEEPDPIRILITRDGVFAAGKRVAGGAGAPATFSPLPTLEGLNGIFAGVSEATAKDFEVTFLASDRLRLTPRSARLAEWVSQIEIRLGGEARVPTDVRLEEPGGDVTEIAFRDVVVNPPLDDAAFAP
jgi:outer membrane lipoprotein-sorting protein